MRARAAELCRKALERLTCSCLLVRRGQSLMDRSIGPMSKTHRPLLCLYMNLWIHDEVSENDLHTFNQSVLISGSLILGRNFKFTWGNAWSTEHSSSPALHGCTHHLECYGPFIKPGLQSVLISGSLILGRNFTFTWGNAWSTEHTSSPALHGCTHHLECYGPFIKPGLQIHLWHHLWYLSTRPWKSDMSDTQCQKLPLSAKPQSSKRTLDLLPLMQVFLNIQSV